MDDERIRQLAEEVLASLRGAPPGPGEAPGLEARVAALEAAVRALQGRSAAPSVVASTVVVATAPPSLLPLRVEGGAERCVMEPDKPCVQSGMCRSLGH